MMGPSAIGAQPPPEDYDEEWLMMQEDEEGEKEQQMQQMQQMQVKCIMIDGENAIISADQFDWLCAQAEKVKNLEKVAEAASAEFNAEIARLTDALRMAADEPNIDKARKIADAALTPNA